MNSRSTRNRKSFQFDSLEIRNAPSHFGAVAHAAVALHHTHAAAHVRHLNDPQSADKSQAKETTSADTSQDNGVETTSSKDPSSPDPKGDR